MAERTGERGDRGHDRTAGGDDGAPALQVRDLHLYYGAAHVLQGVDLRLNHGVLALLGRNGMGKTSLCNAIIGLVPPSAGEIRIFGNDVLGLEPHQVVRRGVAYVPQGRRVWPSLSVDEHLRMVGAGYSGAWTLERVYAAFPRLHERRANGAADLSGGEQQMLAIGRALLHNPRLMIMDEPTEGLAPVIVDQIAGLLGDLAQSSEISILLVEQNLQVALDVASDVAVMVNGRITLETTSDALAQDRDLQRRLLGVAKDTGHTAHAPSASAAEAARAEHGNGGHGDRGVGADDADPPADAPRRAAVSQFTRWGHGSALYSTGAAAAPPEAGAPPTPPSRWQRASIPRPSDVAEAGSPRPSPGPMGAREPAVPSFDGALTTSMPFRPDSRAVIYVAGTYDTKERELRFLADCVRRTGLTARTVDLATSSGTSFADVRPSEVADRHPDGRAAVFTGDRGSAVAAMATAFTHWLAERRDLGGVIAAGGSGATALVTPAMQVLPIGVPKVMVSTVASGDVSQYVGPSDLCMMHSVTDVSGINRISEQVLSNAAHALAGMVGLRRSAARNHRPALGLTMFGVTTPCVQAVARALEADGYDCLVFHATGTGGQSMEKLVASGLLSGVLDISLTEVCDLHMGGVMSAGPTRLDFLAENPVPWVGSLGALDMVNWGPMDTVPERFAGRNLYRHNPQVTLMRTTLEECREMGAWIGRKLSQAVGPQRLLIPEGGVSALDAPGQAFWDPEADRALFDALEAEFKPSPSRRLVRRSEHINDPGFADALVAAWREVAS